MQAYKITNSPTHSLPAKSTSCSLVQKFDFFDPGTTLLGAEAEYVGSWDREEGSVDLGRRVELAGEAWQEKYSHCSEYSNHVVSASLIHLYSQVFHYPGWNMHTSISEQQLGKWKA